VRWLDRLPYAKGLALQERLVTARRDDAVPDTLLVLEHPPVITLGRAADPDNVVADEPELARRGIEVHDCGRGGDVTYHGPGQLIGYPIVRLGEDRRDAHRYLRDLEQALIDAVAELGVEAARVPGLTGIWVGDEKLAAIGVRLSAGWITSHGFALNVCPDLSAFTTIVPCGIRGRGVTSLAHLTGNEIDLQRVAEITAPHVARVLGLRMRSAEDPAERLAVA
jgi:lipoyl(octanoyl) transferase